MNTLVRTRSLALVSVSALVLASACNSINLPPPRATWAVTIAPTRPTATATVTPTPGPTATTSLTDTPRPTLTPVPPTPTATPVPLPSAAGEQSWKTYQGPAKAFEISLPPNWVQSFLDPKALQTTIVGLTQANPELTTFLTLALAGGTAFAGTDPATIAQTSGLPTGVMVLKQPMGLVRTGEFLAALLKSAAQMAEGVKKPIESRKVRLASGEAEEVVLRYAGLAAGGAASTSTSTPTPTSSDVVQVLYILTDKDSFYIIGFTTSANQYDGYKTTFEKIAQSFRFTQ